MIRPLIHLRSLLLFGVVTCSINISILLKQATSPAWDIGISSSSSDLIAEEENDGAPSSSGDNSKHQIMRKDIDSSMIIQNDNDSGSTSSVAQDHSAQQSLPNDESCKRLIAHHNGHWHHTTPSDIITDTSQLPSEGYFPTEMDWLEDGMPRQVGKCDYSSDKPMMYTTPLGHHCGCGMKAFKPTHSVWVNNSTTTTDDDTIVMPEMKPPHRTKKSHDFAATTSPTLRLIKKLANVDATVCFAGDSVDYQIYKALLHNLRRMYQLHEFNNPNDENKLLTLLSREIPVVHSTDPGNFDDWYLHGHRPPDLPDNPSFDNFDLRRDKRPPGGFCRYSMGLILETEAIFRDIPSEGNVRRAKLRYYMSHAWSPWNVEFMEDCNVIVMNQALHYRATGKNLGIQNRQPLLDDTLAAISFLSNFTASKSNRVAVWRSALPQNFATSDGHYQGKKSMTRGSVCSTIDRDPQKPEQTYNKVHDEAFSKMCKLEQPDNLADSSCAQFRHRCSVNPLAEVEYQTMFNFWSANNCTDCIERERLRLSKLSAGVDENSGHVIGTIHRWNIFNLFDVESWHVRDSDCTHYCYVPSLFEAAFERLELLLSPLIASFDGNHS